MNKLTIVIPALDEEGAIGDTIQRCLDARSEIIKKSGLDDVEIIVVSDGSTDRTAEIAASFTDVHAIIFDENRGYGAAIKEGWRRGTGNLLGFLDADGTCNPLFFGELCRTSILESADVVLGSRLGASSKMPLLRRLGNRVYAFLLGFLCARHITDTASGMRVVRRDAIRDLYPLPDGLHFTPSMSARAILNGLRVVELPMKYEERVGDSKLSVFRDGVRFLNAIFSGVLCYRPERLFLIGFSICALAVILMAARPAEFYFEHRAIEEWMVYRFLACHLAASVGLMLLLATALSHQMAHFSRRRSEANTFWPPIIANALQGKSAVFIMTLLGIGALYFLWPGVVQYVLTKQVHLHWSRVIAGAFGLSSLAQISVFAVLVKVVSLWKSNQSQDSVAESGRDVTTSLTLFTDDALKAG